MNSDVSYGSSDDCVEVIYGDDHSMVVSADSLAFAKSSFKYVCADLNSINKSFFSLGFHLWEIKRCSYYRMFGYSDFYDFCFCNFGLKKSVVSRLVSINERFSAKDDVVSIGGVKSFGCRSCISSRFRDYSYSQLCELVSVSDNILSEFTPDMTVKEMRSKKKILKESVAMSQQIPSGSMKFFDNFRRPVDQAKENKDVVLMFGSAAEKESVYLTVCDVYGKEIISATAEVVDSFEGDNNSVKCLIFRLKEV